MEPYIKRGTAFVIASNDPESFHNVQVGSREMLKSVIALRPAGCTEIYQNFFFLFSITVKSNRVLLGEDLKKINNLLHLGYN